MAPIDEVGVLLRLGDCMGCACGRIFVKAGTDSLILSHKMLGMHIKLAFDLTRGLVRLLFRKGNPTSSTSLQQGC